MKLLKPLSGLALIATMLSSCQKPYKTEAYGEFTTQYGIKGSVYLPDDKRFNWSGKKGEMNFYFVEFHDPKEKTYHSIKISDLNMDGIYDEAYQYHVTLGSDGYTDTKSTQIPLADQKNVYVNMIEGGKNQVKLHHIKKAIEHQEKFTFDDSQLQSLEDSLGVKKWN